MSLSFLMQLSKTLSVLSRLVSRTRVPAAIHPRLHLCHSPLLRRFCISEAMSSAKGSKVYITRRVPPGGIKLLKEAGCQLIEWSNDEGVPRDELLKGVAGVDAIYCLLSDKIDNAVLEAAGEYLYTLMLLEIIKRLGFRKLSKIN